jgi:hypothetical protein
MRRRNSERNGIGRARTAIKPRIVIGATNGATRTLKSTLNIETSPERKMM